MGIYKRLDTEGINTCYNTVYNSLLLIFLRKIFANVQQEFFFSNLVAKLPQRNHTQIRWQTVDQTKKKQNYNLILILLKNFKTEIGVE